MRRTPRPLGSLLGSLLVSALLALVLLASSGTTAHADPQRLLLSGAAGGPWTESLATPLFSGTFVPGTATSSFWVRNGSPSTTRVTIALVPKGAVNELERSLGFRAAVGGLTGAPVPLAQDRKKNECRTLVTGPTLAPGGIQRIDVTMDVARDLTRAASGQRATFSFVVTLSQVTTKGKVDVCGTQAPGGQAVVSGAGTPVAPDVDRTPRASGAGLSLVAASATGALLLTSGALTVVVRRRRGGV